MSDPEQRRRTDAVMPGADAPIAPPAAQPVRPTRAEVDLTAVADNVRRITELTDTPVCAVVKADGYGHGAAPAARAALAAGASWLAVALVEEGEELRAAGVDAPILLLSEPPVAATGRVLAAELVPSVYRPAFVEALHRAGRDRGHPVDVHAMVDTGMGRVGMPLDGWPDLLDLLASRDGVRLAGTWTHLACADEPAASTTGEQLARFDEALAAARRRGLDPGLVHAANTAGGLCHPAARRDLIRAGIGIYGLSPSAEVTAAGHGLRPALRLVSEVSFVKRVQAGTRISYGHRWAAPADGFVATVPIGYADGVPRLLSGRAEVLLGDRRRPVAGTVTMDQLMVWCADHDPAVGDEVVLLGGSPGVTAEEWAAWAGTITYEVATSLSRRVPRVYTDGPV